MRFSFLRECESGGKTAKILKSKCLGVSNRENQKKGWSVLVLVLAYPLFYSIF